MKYERIVSGKFISRPNRFVAQVELDGREQIVHVKNTGRCKELLIPGNVVYLQKAENPRRKTAYDLIAVEKGHWFVNVDSQIPNAVAEEWLHSGNLFSNLEVLRREVTYGDSRFDLYAEYGSHRAFIEVKGVTLEKEGVAYFPDAPTERGIKHIHGLMQCMDDGYEAYILFVIQMQGIRRFEPNRSTHPEFAEALKQGQEKGVHILAYDCRVTPDSIILNEPVEVRV